MEKLEALFTSFVDRGYYYEEAEKALKEIYTLANREGLHIPLYITSDEDNCFLVDEVSNTAVIYSFGHQNLNIFNSVLPSEHTWMQDYAPEDGGCPLSTFFSATEDYTCIILVTKHGTESTETTYTIAISIYGNILEAKGAYNEN